MSSQLNFEAPPHCKFEISSPEFYYSFSENGHKRNRKKNTDRIIIFHTNEEAHVLNCIRVHINSATEEQTAFILLATVLLATGSCSPTNNLVYMFNSTEIVEYLVHHKNNSLPISIQQFVIDKEDYIIQHTTIRDSEDIVNVWSSRFNNATREANIKSVRVSLFTFLFYKKMFINMVTSLAIFLETIKKKIDWIPIMSKVLQKISACAATATNYNDSPSRVCNNNSNNDNTSGSDNNNDDGTSGGNIIDNSSSNERSTSSFKSNQQQTTPPKINSSFKTGDGSSSSKRTRSTSAKKDSQKLTNEMKEEYTLSFEAMDDEKNLAHSFILDVHDPCWKKIFTPTQFKTIETEGNPAFSSYSVECKKMFSSLSNVVKSFKKSSRTNTASSSTSSSPTFIPISSEEDALIVDELWKAVVEYGLIDPKTRYNEHWIQKTMIEIIDLYRYKVDKTSVAASYIDNKDRIVTGLAPIADKVTSIRPDLALFRGGTEYGAAECGKGGDAKKELVEVNLHCPKVLKNMFGFAADKCDNEKDLIRSIRIVCFNQFHLHTSVSVMDNPGGYVCRVRSTPQYDVSSHPFLFTSGLLKILKLTLKVKYTIQASIKIVEDHLECDDTSDSESDSEIDVKSNCHVKDALILPPLMRCSYKKQKIGA
ncbi:hypothetical protein BDC45DRAFT_534824 [Circinella umbellata]|nr:hypothetical protein BDC45DRAFT_534824 [Circinella umbellata]